MIIYVHLPPPHPGCRIFHPLHPQLGVPVGSPGSPGSPRTHRRADPTPGTKHWAQEAPAVFLQGNSTAAQANPLIFDGLFYGFLIYQFNIVQLVVGLQHLFILPVPSSPSNPSLHVGTPGALSRVVSRLSVSSVSLTSTASAFRFTGLPRGERWGLRWRLPHGIMAVVMHQNPEEQVHSG